LPVASAHEIHGVPELSSAMLGRPIDPATAMVPCDFSTCSIEALVSEVADAVPYQTPSFCVHAALMVPSAATATDVPFVFRGVMS